MIETRTFKIRVVAPGDIEESFYEDDPATMWAVYLPHKCQAWEIAGDESAGRGTVDTWDNRSEVIAELKQFINEAQEALSYIENASV